jgi:holo-[acyl-carrier protein] synthase
MILGVGTDIFRNQRMEEALARGGDRMLRRIFTPREMMGTGEGRRKAEYLATRFAGKEAIFKTFGKGWEDGQGFTDIEILTGENGEPKVALHGRTLEMAMDLKGKVLLSLSHDGEYSIAVALLIREDHPAVSSSM